MRKKCNLCFIKCINCNFSYDFLSKELMNTPFLNLEVKYGGQ